MLKQKEYEDVYKQGKHNDRKINPINIYANVYVARKHPNVVKINLMQTIDLQMHKEEIITGRIENVQIFNDTRRMCRSNPKLINAIRASARGQECILETDTVHSEVQSYSEPSQILVSRKRTFEAASHYFGKKVCVLNFASSTNPGGGVAWGSTAQEEALCRCSTLYYNLTSPDAWQSFYEPHRNKNNPLYNDDCIYTPDVVVFKTDTIFPETMPEDEWWKVNVITCAAPNLRNDRDGSVQVTISNNELRNLHIKRMRRILDIAAAQGNEVIVLGAFGCGAFKNPPEIVADAMKQVVSEYRCRFKVIEFAVYCSPRDDRNYQVFHKITV